MKDFQQLIDKGIINKVTFNSIEANESVDKLISLGLITQVGMVDWVRKWWDSEESNLPDTVSIKKETGETMAVVTDDPTTPEIEHDPVNVKSTPSVKEPEPEPVKEPVKETKTTKKSSK